MHMHTHMHTHTYTNIHEYSQKYKLLTAIIKLCFIVEIGSHFKQLWKLFLEVVENIKDATLTHHHHLFDCNMVREKILQVQQMQCVVNAQYHCELDGLFLLCEIVLFLLLFCSSFFSPHHFQIVVFFFFSFFFFFFLPLSQVELAAA